MITVERQLLRTGHKQLRGAVSNDRKGFVRLWELFSKVDDSYVERSMVGFRCNAPNPRVRARSDAQD